MTARPRSDALTLAGVFLVADGIGALLLGGLVYVAIFATGSPAPVPADQSPIVVNAAVLGLIGFGVIALVAAMLVLRLSPVGRVLGIAVGLIAGAYLLGVLAVSTGFSAYEIVLILVVVAMQAVIAVPLALWSR